MSNLFVKVRSALARLSAADRRLPPDAIAGLVAAQLARKRASAKAGRIRRQVLRQLHRRR